ncbi:hypothetical protein [Mycolicibacterium aichiense]|uniref:Uncharacterized protein n=1 Tax=Mycolicibacterium aichiense TaxID=1799 RepID=A0AAD1MAV3_9MYCO|nr:hypothetical protein [Mycolicibacterium aichiense]MCV7021300.1 hypothetical protein [Mycolicibacterium aichiense]BBX05880.1 hypothetical protein MAIC_06830 [Mycolicibacterium aichiense]STZ24779.1 Uncharacterised protein [Mycolicibacterium aichiense]
MTLSQTVLDYSALMKRLVDEAKQPGFSTESWAPLAELIDTQNFVRVGNFKEVMNWDTYIAFLTNWATSSEWESEFKRVTEAGDVVFLELEERSRIGDFSNSVNSVSVYEFDQSGKITRIDVYLQMALPDPDMLASYQGVEI